MVDNFAFGEVRDETPGDDLACEATSIVDSTVVVILCFSEMPFQRSALHVSSRLTIKSK